MPTSKRGPGTFTKPRAPIVHGNRVSLARARWVHGAKEQRPWGSNGWPKSTAAEHRSILVSATAGCASFKLMESQRQLQLRNRLLQQLFQLRLTFEQLHDAGKTGAPFRAADRA